MNDKKKKKKMFSWSALVTHLTREEKIFFYNKMCIFEAPQYFAFLFIYFFKWLLLKQMGSNIHFITYY